MGLLRSPDGTIVNVPDEQEGSARAGGYTPVSIGEAGATTGALTPEETGAAGAVTAGATGALSGLTLGASDYAFKGLLDRGDFEHVAASRAQHPYATGAGELGGMLLPALATGGAAAGVEGLGARILSRAPAAGVSRIGAAVSGIAGEGAGLLGRTAAASAGAAAEGALYGGGQYLSQTALEDKPLSAEGFVGAMGNGALFAAPVGGAFTLAESALVRARSLFPRSEMTAAAGREAQHEATSQLGQTLSDGEAMAQTARQRIGLADAKQGMAEAGEQVTRRAFGGADPQAIVDQAAHSAESQQIADALQKFHASMAKFTDWAQYEADVEIEDALRGLRAPGSQELPTIPPPSGVPVGEFGATGSRGVKTPDELAHAVVAAGTDGTRAAPLLEYPATKVGRRAAATGTPAEAATVPAKEIVQRGEQGVATDGTAGARAFDSEAEFRAEQDRFREGGGRVPDAVVIGEHALAGGAISAATKGDSLTGLLRGTQDKLAAGSGLSEMGAPARAEYAAGKAARASDAAEHFRAQAMARNYAGSEMAAGERAAQGASVPVMMTSKMRAQLRDLGLSADEIANMTPAKAWERINEGAVKRNPTARVGKNVDMSAQFGRAAEVIGGVESASADLADALGADAPAGAVKRAADYRTAVRAQAEASSSSAARAAGDASSKLPTSGSALMKLFGLEGAAEPGAATAAGTKGVLEEHGIGSGAAKTQVEPGGAARARAAHDSAPDKTAVTSDVDRALQRHESATEGAKDRALVSMQRAESKAAAKESAAAGTGPPVGAPTKGSELASKMGTAATALEVLKAMGVHVPALSAIPVIGPVLGAYFKAKAVLSILGRKGGSIPGSTESLIAAKAAQTRDRIVAATQSIVTNGIKVGKVAGPATASILAVSLFPGGKKETSSDPQALYHARMDEIAHALAPGALQREIGDRVQTSDPALLDAVTAQAQRGIAFLDSKAPKQTMLPGMVPGDGIWHPSKAALDEWAKYVRAVNDPASVLEDLSKGRITMEGAETLRVVYPLLFAEAQKRLLDAAPKMQKTLPYPTRVAIQIMYQIPLDSTMTPAHVQFLSQNASAAGPAPGQPMPAPGGPALTGPITLGQRTMTVLDRRAGA
jgi:hypothetical protein